MSFVEGNRTVNNQERNEGPRRVQRKRTAGWRMPEGAVYVGRPSRWGNPYPISEVVPRDLSVALFANTASGIWSPTPIQHFDDGDFEWIYSLHRRWTKHIGGHPVEVARSQLAGHDLACWCSPNVACHADVLLEIANPSVAASSGGVS